MMDLSSRVNHEWAVRFLADHTRRFFDRMTIDTKHAEAEAAGFKRPEPRGDVDMRYHSRVTVSGYWRPI